MGAGVTGIYQLYLAREAGYSVQLVDAGTGVGGTWYWNRYPGARYDSESYTYGYFFSEELFKEWEWSEHFAGPGGERALLQPRGGQVRPAPPHPVQHQGHVGRLGRRLGDLAGHGGDGYTARARYLVAATGVLSVPFYPDVPGRESFRGEAYHTGLWPKTAVDFTGKRVAVIGTGSSGVQIIPVIAPEVASLTVYQRTPNWATPLNNRPITPEEQAELKAGFEAIRDTVGKSPSGFLHQPSDKMTFDDSPEERQAFYERVWQLGGFGKIISNYRDMTMNPAANAEWSRFVADKIRAVVKDPATAEKLIPNDHGYAGKRPPYVTGYYEAYNRPNVSLVDLKETPITAVTETGIETADGLQEFDIIVWATGFDFGTGALNRLGIVGRDGLPLEEYWADGPLTYLGIMAHHFPNFFFPGGPHGGAGNNPRYNGDQSDFIAGLIDFAREHGHPVIEVPKALEDEWTTMVNEAAITMSPFNEKSYFFGTNIPGKAKAFLLNSLGRPKLLEMMEAAAKSDYAGFFPGTESTESTEGPDSVQEAADGHVRFRRPGRGRHRRRTRHRPGLRAAARPARRQGGGQRPRRQHQGHRARPRSRAGGGRRDHQGRGHGDRRLQRRVHRRGRPGGGRRGRQRVGPGRHRGQQRGQRHLRRPCPRSTSACSTPILAVHVRGTFNVTRAAWPHMLAQNYGRVVLTGSTGMFGMPDNLSYATAKSAMIGMAQAMTGNAGDHDIKVNVIAPNAWTRMAGDPSEGMDQLRAARPAGAAAAPGARAGGPDGRLSGPRELPGQRRDLPGGRRAVRPAVRRLHRRLPAPRTTSRRRSRTSPPTGRRSTTRPATTCPPAR